MQIDNPYLNVLVTAGLTVLFIIASCYGLGTLAAFHCKAERRNS